MACEGVLEVFEGKGNFIEGMLQKSTYFGMYIKNKDLQNPCFGIYLNTSRWLRRNPKPMLAPITVQLHLSKTFSLAEMVFNAEDESSV